MPHPIFAALKTSEVSFKWGKRLLKAAGLIDSDLEKISQDSSYITSSFETVFDQLDRILFKIDDQVTRLSKMGLIHLETAIEYDKEDRQRDEELSKARDKFLELVTLAPCETTNGTSNKSLIGLGYWGNYNYFLITNKPKFALKQVYECAEKHPIMAFKFFNPDFYGEENKSIPHERRQLDILTKIHSDMKLWFNFSTMSIRLSGQCIQEAKNTWRPGKKIRKHVEAMGYQIGGAVTSVSRDLVGMFDSSQYDEYSYFRDYEDINIPQSMAMLIGLKTLSSIDKALNIHLSDNEYLDLVSTDMPDLKEKIESDILGLPFFENTANNFSEEVREKRKRRIDALQGLIQHLEHKMDERLSKFSEECRDVQQELRRLK